MADYDRSGFIAISDKCAIFESEWLDVGEIRGGAENSGRFDNVIVVGESVRRERDGCGSSDVGNLRNEVYIGNGKIRLFVRIGAGELLNDGGRGVLSGTWADYDEVTTDIFDFARNKPRDTTSET